MKLSGGGAGAPPILQLARIVFGAQEVQQAVGQIGQLQRAGHREVHGRRLRCSAASREGG